MVKAWAKSEAEAARLQFALVGVPTSEAFVPTPGTSSPKLGIPFDDEENPAWPSDKTARIVDQVGANETTRNDFPPPCDGNNSAGQYIAGAQLDNALQAEGDGCGIGLCPSRDEA